MESDLSKCTDPTQKQELKLELEFQEFNLKRRSVGNLKFIGELYKLNLLGTPAVMFIRLLKKGDEESLECLLSTRSRPDPTSRQQLDENFADMSTIVRERRCANRIRFLIMDVIDLRRNRWVPRRKVAQPKKIAEVHEEAKKEEEQKQSVSFGRYDRYRN